MRADVNVSVRHAGEPFRTRCEVKNVNSIRFVMQAVEAEAQRQVEVWESGGEVVQETRLFDSARGETRSMRSKEDATTTAISPTRTCCRWCWMRTGSATCVQHLPELPDAKRARFVAETRACRRTIPACWWPTRPPPRSSRRSPSGRDAKAAANWVMGDLFAALNRTGRTIEDSPVSAAALGEMLDLMADGTINGRIAKDVFEAMVETGEMPRPPSSRRAGLRQVTDTGAIDAAVEAVIAANPDKLEQYRAGKDKLFGFFVGQVMKAMAGKGNPALINAALKARIG